MGTSVRARPKRLAEKLLQIREALGLSQTEMGRRVGLTDEFARNYVSGYERNTREPTLEVLLAYARCVSTSEAGKYLEALIDDRMILKLSKNLPDPAEHEGMPRTPVHKISKDKRIR